jgi:hypothetical protein
VRGRRNNLLAFNLGFNRPVLAENNRLGASDKNPVFHHGTKATGEYDFFNILT